MGPTAARDVEVRARDDEQLGAVLVQLGRMFGTTPRALFSGDTGLPHDLTLQDARLRHGAVLGVDRPVGGAGAASEPGALELRVVGGPDAGRGIALTSGTHVVGRGVEAGLSLDDPNVSRRHVVVHVGQGTVEVSDCGSRNGTMLDDRQVAERSAWTADARLHVGASTLLLAEPDAPQLAVVGVADGRTVLAPSMSMPDVREPVEVGFPQVPTAPAHRRLAWIAVALPAVGGIALAVVLRTPAFLFFALLSPLVAIASWWSDRRSGRRTHRRELLDHGRRTAEAEARLAEAVAAEVRAMHRRLPDLASLTAAARRRTSPLWVRAPGDADQLTIRVGTAPGATGAVRRDADGSRTAAEADGLPVPVDLRSGGLTVVGPRTRTLGVLRAAVGQMAALHPPDSVDLLLVTSPRRLADWRWLRWLPHLQVQPFVVPDERAAHEAADPAARALLALVERRRAAGRAVNRAPWPGPWTVLVIDGPVPGPVTTALASAADVGISVLTHGPTAATMPAAVRTVLTVTGELGTHARLETHGRPARLGVALDQLPLDVASDLAHDLAGLAPPAGRSALPHDVRLLDVTRCGTHQTDEQSPEWSRDRRSLVVTLGVGSDGVERIDLCRQGPHALVAGTTGAGKSELLQTLIAGLALAHPPDRCSFLLVDYKGGAAFADAATLPHTVGLLTDLDESTTARALTSLGAELTRREALLAAHAVADLADLPDDVPLARLVMVVDEFAALAEELPDFVPGLVGIAQRGRSLGIHLVLATQRPAGVVSADIRANCTLRICLRTTDEADSRDVLGTPEAAHLPLEVPGRALVRTGTGAARLLQVARVSQPPPVDSDAPVVTPWRWPAPPLEPAPSSAAESDLAGLVRTLEGRAGALALTPPHRPWREPLPASLDLDEAEALTGTAVRPRTHLLLGVLDHPEAQAQRPLVLDLTEGGGWLVVGGPRSGRTTALRSVLGQAVSRLSVDELHVHVVDAGGALASTSASLPSVGTVISGDDPLRTVRLVRRLGEEVARRRSAGTTGDPHVLLLVDGAEALFSVLEEADPARGSAELLRLVRDGGAVGLTCVLTADRAVPGGRLAGVAQHRLVLPLPDRADYAVAGIRPSAVPSSRPPGRAVVGEAAAACQLVLPGVIDRGTGEYGNGRSSPLRIVQLDPDPLRVGALPDDASTQLRVALGPGGDAGEPLTVGLLGTGGLLVVGPPGSGRTAAVDAITGDLTAAGVPVWHGDVDDPTELADWLEACVGTPAVVCVDDLRPAGSAPALATLPQLGAGSGVTLVATSTAADLSTWFQGPVAALRRARSGLLLCPGPGDADVLGIRLPRTPVPVRPGSGWLVRAGVPERVQVARRRARPAPAQSSSRTGPISCVAYHASS